MKGNSIMILYDEKESSATPTDAIDYDKLGEVIYSNTYNAMVDYYDNNEISYKKETIPTTKTISSSYTDSPLVFASSTDAQLYTVQTVDAPNTVAQQVGAYTLDTRNILLIFLLTWLLVTIYSKLKNTLYNFFWRS